MRLRPGVIACTILHSNTRTRTHTNTQKARGAVTCHCQSLSHRGVDSHLVQSAFIYRGKARTEKQWQVWKVQRDSRLESKMNGSNKKKYHQNNIFKNKHWHENF